MEFLKKIVNVNYDLGLYRKPDGSYLVVKDYGGGRVEETLYTTFEEANAIFVNRGAVRI